MKLRDVLILANLVALAGGAYAISRVDTQAPGTDARPVAAMKVATAIATPSSPADQPPTAAPAPGTKPATTGAPAPTEDRPAVNKPVEDKQPAAAATPAQQQVPAADTTPPKPEKPVVTTTPAMQEPAPVVTTAPAEPKQPATVETPAEETAPVSATPAPSTEKPAAAEPSEKKPTPVVTTTPPATEKPAAATQPEEKPAPVVTNPAPATEKPAVAETPEQKPTPVVTAPPAQTETPAAATAPAQAPEPTVAAPMPAPKPVIVEAPLPEKRPDTSEAALEKHRPAKYLFAAKKLPSTGRSRAIGYYPKGCLAGGVELPVDGPNWQVMRLSRNRNWGHPELVRFLERFAPAAAKATGWPGILIGDMGQPRGGPLPFGHKSHQIGFDVDIWFKPMPDRRLTRKERNTISATHLVLPDGKHLNPKTWSIADAAFIRTAAEQPEVERVLVNAAIKQELCKLKGKKHWRWMAKVRPWYGHDDHIHVRLKCPAGSPHCRHQPAVPGGAGCSKKALAFWFSDRVLHPKLAKHPKPRKQIMLTDLPRACKAVLNAPAKKSQLAAETR